jgi:hypothetical protein
MLPLPTAVGATYPVPREDLPARAP